MSTLAEVETAVDSLTRHEQETLYAYLHDRLQSRDNGQADCLDALAALQNRLALDANKVSAWQTSVRDARR